MSRFVQTLAAHRDDVLTAITTGSTTLTVAAMALCAIGADRADTEFLGTLSFRDGMPSAETAEKALDFLTVSRGVEAFLSGLSATSGRA